MRSVRWLAPCQRWGAVLGAGLALAALLSSCAFSNIDLIQDHRVHILSPHAGQTVQLPVTIRWRTTGLSTGVGRLAVRFAVFVDRPVVKPGASLRSIASGDSQCLRVPSCPGPTYLREHGVYVVAGTQLTLPFLADLRNPSAGITKDQHTVTIVILRGDHRDGESAFSVTFYVARSGTA
ncbi:MAG: hypothetical protein ACYDB7_12710 [Mycobacteriales bacterium]